MSKILFEKHVHGRTKKRKFQSVEEFDPRPESCQATVDDRLPKLLDRVRGKGLCVSLLLDSTTQVWAASGDKEESLTPSLPSVDQFKNSSNEVLLSHQKKHVRLNKLPVSSESLLSGLMYVNIDSPLRILGLCIGKSQALQQINWY